MDLNKIKQRDRWACKRCGRRFEDLIVHCFGNGDSEDDYITICQSCFAWTLSNINIAQEFFKQAVRRNKVVFVGDCHGNFDKLNQVLDNEYPFDFFISVGDVADFKDLSHGDINSIEKVEEWRNLGYYVQGNHDEVELFSQLELVQEINGLKVVGLNGILKSRNFIKDSDSNISFREILYLSHLENVDILVTHQPPTGVFNGFGEPVLEELINYLVPRIYTFGHVHRFRLKFHLNTFMISLPMITKGYAVAYFQGKDLRNLELVFKKGKKFIRV